MGRSRNGRNVRLPSYFIQWTGVPLCALLLATLIGPVSGQQTPTSRINESGVPEEAAKAIDGLWSPYCPGLMLEVCTSAGGAALRDSIEAQARAGLSADSIVNFWVARYGEEYRAVPTFSGTGRFAWLTPVAALLLGLALAAALALRRPSGLRTHPETEPTPEESDRLRQALAELDESEAPDF